MIKSAAWTSVSTFWRLHCAFPLFTSISLSLSLSVVTTHACHFLASTSTVYMAEKQQNQYLASCALLVSICLCHCCNGGCTIDLHITPIQRAISLSWYIPKARNDAALLFDTQRHFQVARQSAELDEGSYIFHCLETSITLEQSWVIWLIF